MLTVDIRKTFRLREGRFALEASLVLGNGITVLFGPSGAGKTTLLRAIAGITVPDAGKIALDNCVYFDSAARINLPMKYRRVGFVFQDYLLFPHLTAQQNVAYGVRADGTESRRSKWM